MSEKLSSKLELGEEDDEDSEELGMLLEEASRLVKLGESRAGKGRARSKSRGADDLISESGGLITGAIAGAVGGRRPSVAGGCGSREASFNSSREGSFNSGRKGSTRAKTDVLPRRGTLTLGTVSEKSEATAENKGMTPTPPSLY